ncbi:hypothetical protein HNQ64_000603 [Prosthecobacter dejongeii]|uniref:Helix-turn-helix domain-containing protein n=1 Tax=Prosthecobacter dejongeii TaxID=48465 RepID=A0A7W7YHS1_9BACT|nr:hypothetical protein [Prosthecobacter dejongeii]
MSVGLSYLVSMISVKPNKKIQNDIEAPLLSRKDVCRIMCVSNMTVKRLQGRGLLTPIYFGPRLIRYRSEDVADLISKSAA